MEPAHCTDCVCTSPRSKNNVGYLVNGVIVMCRLRPVELNSGFSALCWRSRYKVQRHPASFDNISNQSYGAVWGHSDTTGWVTFLCSLHLMWFCFTDIKSTSKSKSFLSSPLQHLSVPEAHKTHQTHTKRLLSCLQVFGWERAAVCLSFCLFWRSWFLSFRRRRRNCSEPWSSSWGTWEASRSVTLL